jgi:hypothetical protein
MVAIPIQDTRVHYNQLARLLKTPIYVASKLIYKPEKSGVARWLSIHPANEEN